MTKIILKRISTLLISLTIILLLIPSIAFAEALNYSESYDPRELEVMTPVKNQNPLGVCWAFSGIAATESYLKLHGYGEWDFSEEYVRWWATYNELGYGWNKTSRDGGPTQIMPGYLTSWQGLREEKDIPYTTYYYSERPDNMDTAEGKFNVTDLVYVNNDSLKVKDAILKYGAVSSTFYDSFMYLNNSSSAYYCNNENNAANHNIIIVGWDDNYSKDNFKESIKPVNNGAWLIKNSWGVNNSEGGYLWISYEDKLILSDSASKINYAIKAVEEVDKNIKIYQYDEYGATSSLYLNNDSGKVQEMTYANVYNFESEYEILDKIMFNSVNAGAKYSLYYAPVVNNLPVLTVDKMIILGDGVIEDPGYMTIDIEDYTLPKGKGAIVVYLNNRENNDSVSLGCEVNLTYAGGILAYKADAKVGESYIYSDNELIDLNESFTDTPRSLTIKAITRKSSDATIGSVEVNGLDITSTMNNDNYYVKLPYSSINSKTIIKVTANNENGKVNSINLGIKDLNVAEEDIIIPNSGQVSPIEITCKAADGSIKTYTLNITIASEIKSSEDILKYIEIMDKDNTTEIINLNKYYDNLESSEKSKLSEDVVANILKKREHLEVKFHEEKGVKVKGIPWQVDINVKYLIEEDEDFIKIKEVIGNKKVIEAYDISLIDHYTNLSYTNIGEEVILTFTIPKLGMYENIRVLQLKSNGETEYLVPIIDKNILTIKVDSFSSYAIIGQEILKVSSTTNDNKKDIIDKAKTSLNSDAVSVNSGDNESIILYVVLSIVSLTMSIFIIINLIKKKNKRN